MRISDWSSDVCSSDLAGTWRANLAKFYSEVAANMKLRQIVIADAPAVQAIYAPYVAATTISFEEVPPDILEVERRIAALLPHYPYLVAEVEDRTSVV